MIITCENLGKKYNKEWIFKGITDSYSTNDFCLVQGGNGSGKSTFLKLISGFLTPSAGSVSYNREGTKIVVDTVYKKVAYCAPYIDVFEQYTAFELFQFQSRLKPFIDKIDYTAFMEIIRLSNVKNKPIKDFSSGMKQRIKLGLAILAETEILLLDEPSSNLDKEESDLVYAFTKISEDSKEKGLMKQKYFEYEEINKIYEKEIEEELKDIELIREDLGNLKFEMEKEFEIRGKIKMDIEHIGLILNVVDNDDTGKVDLDGDKEKELIEFRYLFFIVIY